MDLTRPAASLLPSLDAEVLMVLSGTTRPLTGREVARLVRHGSQSGVRKVLIRFVDHGLVDVREAGPALLYVLNRDHLVAPLVAGLARLRTDFFERIRRQIAAWQVQPLSAAVFGSAARGDGDIRSDVDVFLVRPVAVEPDDRPWREQVSELSAAISRWTGNHASMIEVSADEARAMSERAEPVAMELVGDAVPLAGAPVAEVLSGEVP